MAISRFDIDSSVDRLMFLNNEGHLIGLPFRPGTSSAVGTGVPVNGLIGWAPGALFYNVKGTVGSCLYVNVGTNQSSLWVNIDGRSAGLGSAPLVISTTPYIATPGVNTGRINGVNLPGGGTITLPVATGTGNSYRFLVFANVTTPSLVIQRGLSSDSMVGMDVQTGAAGATTSFLPTGANNTITLNGTTTGGFLGDNIVLTDIATGIWFVDMNTKITGTAATPFSTT